MDAFIMQDRPKEEAGRPESPKRPESLYSDTSEQTDTGSDMSSSDETGRARRYRPRSQAFIEEQDRVELQRIATALSHQRFSTVPSHGPPGSLTDYSEIGTDDPALNPQNKEFDMGKWLRHFIQRISETGITPSRAGVIYKDLSVSGTGAELLHQETVGSYLLSPLRIGELFSFGKRHKQILHGFDGLLQSGELLIVLGRPGSGCSTLLKTISGELQGLTVDEKATIHYNGIPQKKMVKEFRGEVIYNQEVCYFKFS